MKKDNSIYWRSCFRMILIFLSEYLYLREKRKEQICFQSGEFGNNCLLYSLDELLRYGDVLNIIQADGNRPGCGTERGAAV